MVLVTLTKDVLYSIADSAGVTGQTPFKKEFNFQLVSKWKLIDEINKLKKFEFDVENTKENRENILLEREMVVPLVNPFRGIITSKTNKKGIIKFLVKEFASLFENFEFKEGLKNEARIKYTDEKWLDKRFKRRRKIIIDSSFVTNTLENIPLQIHNRHDIAQPHLLTQATIDGRDFAITLPDGTTKLSHELEFWSPNDNEYVIRFKVPKLENNNEIGFIYYDNEDAIDAQNLSDVWSDSFAVVYHFQEDPVLGNFKDSVSNKTANDGVPTNITSVGGHHGKGAEFNGIDSKITIIQNSTINNIFAAGGTFEAWINPKSDGEGDVGRIADKNGTSGWLIKVLDEKSGFLKLGFVHGFATADGEWQTERIIPINNQTKIVVEYNKDDVANDPVIYVNGEKVTITEISTPVGTADDDSGGDLFIGNNIGSSATFDGMIDEVRLHAVIRGEDWHRAIVKNETFDTNERPFFLKFLTEEHYLEQTDLIASSIISSANKKMPLLSSTKISDLVSHFTFDENNTVDKFGSNNGVVTGFLEFVKGKIGQSGKFKGAEYITLDNESNFDFNRTNPFSISFWIKYLPQNNKAIITKGTDPILGGSVGIGIWLETDFINFELNGTTEQLRVKTSDKGIANKEFNHVTITYNGNGLASGIKIYFNNELKTNTVVSDTLSSQSILNNLAVVIGANGSGGKNFVGELDDIRIYKKELTSNEVESIFRSNTNSSEPVEKRVRWKLGEGKRATINKLLSLWKFDDDLKDSAAENELTLISGTKKFIDGKFGKALDLDGSTHYASKNESPFDFEKTDSFTFEGWIKSSSTGLETIISKKGTAEGYSISVDNGTTSDDKLIVILEDNAATKINVTADNIKVRDDKFHFISIKYNGNALASGITIKLDNVVKTKTVVQDNLTGSTLNDEKLGIGSLSNGTNILTGIFDDFRIYQRELTDSEEKFVFEQIESGIEEIRTDNIPQNVISLDFAHDKHLEALQKVSKTAGVDLWFDDKNLVVFLGKKGKEIKTNLDVKVLQESKFNIEDTANIVNVLGAETDDIQLEKTIETTKETKFDREITVTDSKIATDSQITSIASILSTQLKDVAPEIKIEIPYDQYNRFILESGDTIFIAEQNQETQGTFQILKIEVQQDNVKLTVTKPQTHTLRASPSGINDLISLLFKNIENIQTKT